MTHRTTFAPEAIQFYLTAAYACSYLPGRIARSQVAVTAKNLPAQAYSMLVQHGFRRSGEFIYRPHCDHCNACTSIRIPVTNFKASRSQRRALTKHRSLVTHFKPVAFSEEHYALYQRYQKARHAGGGMDHDHVDQYVDFLVSTRVNSCVVEFREGPDGPMAGQLRMVSIIDRLDDGLSAVYTFFEPDAGQSFGIYNVLWQISYTQLLGLRYLYLGYWIENSQKMSYKRNFQPNEVLLNDIWGGFDHSTKALT